jgi:hypothetical protein
LTPAAPAPAGGKAREPIRALKLAEAARIRDQQLQAEREAKRRKIKAEMEQRSAARAAAANVKPFDITFKSKGPAKGVTKILSFRCTRRLMSGLHESGFCQKTLFSEFVHL